MKCPICSSDEVNPLLDLGLMPLSVLGLVSDAKESVAGKRHRVNIYTCSVCKHAYNYEYDPGFEQPFEGGCTMYNAGGDWAEHMNWVAGYLVRECARGGLIIEIGAGNGEFAKLCDCPDYIAYEPCQDASECGKHVTTVPAYFNPEIDVAAWKPSAIVMRHVLEHFAHPVDFLRELAKAVRGTEIDTSLLIEVPNVRPALGKLRVEDWVYEHPHHFTPDSLRVMACLAGWDVTDLFVRYGGEVIVAAMTPQPHWDVDRSEGYATARRNLVQGRDELLAGEGPVVLWGGAGKGATLINLLGLPTGRTVVVDSDSRKWGKYVPGTCHVIHDPQCLRRLKPATVVVTTSWRAADITAEIIREEYQVGRIMNFVGGQLTIYQG